jgi:hypothetical protein
MIADECDLENFRSLLHQNIPLPTGSGLSSLGEFFQRNVGKEGGGVSYIQEVHL